MHPSHIESFDVSRCKEALQKWYEKTPVKVKDNNNQTILSVKDVSFAYDAQNKVLEQVSFDIKEGEMVSIVGRNGAGKSTLSSLICGFMPLTEGQILLEGQDISPLSIRERGEKIGFVMQNPNHMISKSMIFEEVALGLEVRGVPKVEIEERVNETLRICGLYPFRNWPISALSFGQKKRMTIASILVLNPKILILDEPTAGQDFRHYTEIMEFLKMLNREHHVTIIMITHDMHLMLEYTHRALVLSEGHLLADASPAKVLTDEQLTQAAYLKRTSLYDLSKKCDLSDPSAFVERFIAYDEEARNHG
jgi:energy-coupling factor transport system ATP-binding protein